MRVSADLLLFGLLLGAAGCTTTASTDATLRYDGTVGSVPATFQQNVLRVKVSVNGSPERPVVVDTGAAVTAFDTNAFGNAGFTSGNAKTVGIGGATFHDVPAVSVSLCGTSCGDASINGLLGANLLRQFVVSFDYQGGSFTLGASTVPDWAEPNPIVIPFLLEGGGRGKIQGSETTLDVPATRIAVTAIIEGTPRSIVIDTGASYVLVRPGFFQSLLADKRKTLTVIDQTVSGTMQGKIARAKSVAIGDAIAFDVALQTVTDAFVDGLQAEVGHPIDGLVGGSFLRDFAFTIDYPARTLLLHRYKTLDARLDEFHRVGVLLTPTGTGFVVKQMLPGTDAAINGPSKLIGAALVSVDGTKVDGLAEDDADRLLRGNVGDRRSITYATAGATAEVSLLVDDVLAIP